MMEESNDSARKPSEIRKELEDVQSMLQTKAPLAGTQVMVPMTTRAFFAGTLQPTIKEGREQVLVKMVKDNLVELDRSQAVDYLDRRIASLSTTTTDSKKAAAAGESSSVTAKPSLPFFEIREELDESGREIKSEAINVAKQLEYLEKKNGKKGKVSSLVPTASDDTIEFNEEQEKLNPVTDEEYDALSKRLDMLARLEEEAESAKIENQASAKKLQSKGWSKGFLNAKPKKKKTKVKGSISTETPVSDEGRKVAFQPTNQVREIPRVGTRSASELKPSPAQSRKEIEPQVFSGVIRERPIGFTAPESSPSTNPPPKKKLSRFAQERLAEQQQQQR